jgi:coniferyl-aldehyde dehydrogenase
MASIDTALNTDSSDEAAIAALRVSFEAQRRAFLDDPYPPLEARRAHLGALAGAIVGNRQRMHEAMRADFAAHPDLATDLVEVLSVIGRVMHAIEQLDNWAAPEERFADPNIYGTGRASVRYQPKGVVGNIVPWNFPFDLSLGPLVEMLAAGNRVIIKPSEFTPACAEVLQDLVHATFERDYVDVVIGGVELAKAFPTLRWDHLLYTGSPEVGRLVAQAAAANLVPTTLELGGKCPAIIAPDSMDAETVRNVLGTKLIKSGQMCVTVDYTLVPREQLGAFVELARAEIAASAPDYSSGEACTGIISERHLDRLLGLLHEAEESGAQVVQLDEQGVLDRQGRRMPLHLVVDPPAELGIMREEIFGPILPVVPYDSIEDAIDFVNAGERPLGLYVHARDEGIAEGVLRRTTSGGAAVNTCAAQAALPSLGFGGVGQSGNGRHHGVDGFREFSNPRGVFVRGEGDLLDAFAPPYGPETQAVVDAVFGG